MFHHFLIFVLTLGFGFPIYAQTPDCGDTASEVVFRDAFEFSALVGTQGCWDGIASQSTSTIEADTDAAADSATPFGMRVVDGPPGTGATSRVLKNFSGVAAAERWILEFDLRVPDFLMLPGTGGANPELPILYAQFTGGHPTAAEIDLRLINLGNAGVYEPENLAWRLGGRQDSGAFYTGVVSAGDLSGWRRVRIVLTPSSQSGATDGTLALFVDGVEAASLGNVETANQTSPLELRLGRAGGALPGGPVHQGTLDFDNVSLRAIRQPEIATIDDALYRVRLGPVGDPTATQVIEALPGDFDGGGVKLDDHGPGLGQVQVTRTALPDGETQWNLSVTPTDGLAVFEVEFPILRLAPIEGRADRFDDRLVVPFGLGEVISDPHSRSESPQGDPRSVDAIWYGVYGSKFQNMQLVLYEDVDATDGGFMWWTQDTDLFVKDFAVKKIQTGDYAGIALHASVHHFPSNTGQVSASWTLPYPVITTPYSGDWYDAADRYRSWVRESDAPWVTSGTIVERLVSGALPAWYAQNGLWTTGISDIELPFLQSLRNLLDEDAETATLETGVLLSQWQQHAFDTNLPEYFPPKSGCDQPDGDGDGTPDCWYFDYLDLESDRFHIFPYMNIHLASVDGNVPPYTPLIPTFANGTPVADALAGEDPAWWSGDHLEFWNGGYHQAMCRGKQTWIDAISDLILRNVTPYDPGSFTTTAGGYGADGHYVDQLNPGSHYPCLESFSFDGQPQFGFGNYHLNAIRQMAEQVYTAEPGTFLHGEGVTEGLIDLIPEAYLVEPNVINDDIVPLFSTVYQGYAAQHEWPMFPVTDPIVLDNFASLLAPSIHFGHKLGSFQSTVLWKQILVETPLGQTTGEPCVSGERHVCDYLLSLARLKRRSMDVVAYGERLRPPTIDPSDNIQAGVTWCRNKVVPCEPAFTVTPTRDVVEGSVWRSLLNPERVVLLLSNWRAADLAVRVTSADFPAGNWYDLDGTLVAYDPAIALTVPGTASTTHQGWLALTTDFDNDGIRDDVDPVVALPEPTFNGLAGLCSLVLLLVLGRQRAQRL